MSTRIKSGIVGAKRTHSEKEDGSDEQGNPNSWLERVVVEKTKTASESISRWGTGGPSKKSRTDQVKKQDPHCGLLTGIILMACSPKAQTTGGSVAGSGGGKQPSHRLCIAVVGLDTVSLPAFGFKTEGAAGGEEFVPLFSRDPSRSLSFNYCMVGEKIEGKVAKKWTPEKFSKKMDCTFRNGDKIWANVWTPGIDYKQGSLVTLMNVKLVKGVSSNKYFHETCEGRPEFSPYFLNCDVVALNSHRLADLPIHAKLRYFWPINQQFFPSAKEVATELHRQSVSKTEYSEPNVVRTFAAISAEPMGSAGSNQVEAVLNRLKVRDLGALNFSSTYLLCVDESGSHVPSCDECDPRLEQALASLNPSLPPGQSACEKPKKSSGCNDWNDDNFYDLNKSGYKVSVEWPSTTEEIHVQPSGGKEPFVAWSVSASVVQWGYAGCEFEEDYVSPIDPNCETDFATGVVRVAESAPISARGSSPPVRTYKFKRVSVGFKLYNDQMLLGPVGITDLEILLISHKIPFDVLLDLDFSDGTYSCVTMPSIIMHMRDCEEEWNRNGPTEGTAHLNKTEKGAKSWNVCAERLANESERWEEIDFETADRESYRDSQPGDVDGGGSYFVRMIAWRLADYLKNVGGMLLSKALAQRWLSDVDGQSEEPSTTLNPLSAKNDGCFIYLNPKKFNVSAAPSTYEYYALVCYGNNPRWTPQTREATFKTLASKIVDSKSVSVLDDPNRVPLDENLYDYLFTAQNQARIFLYAVDLEKMDACKRAARTRDAGLLDWVRGATTAGCATANNMAATPIATLTNNTNTASVAAAVLQSTGGNLRAPDDSTEDMSAGEPADNAKDDELNMDEEKGEMEGSRGSEEKAQEQRSELGRSKTYYAESDNAQEPPRKKRKPNNSREKKGNRAGK